MNPQQHLSIRARPEPIDLVPARTAVLVVDVQNDFGAEGGMFSRAGIDITPIQAAVAPTARVLAAARAAGMTVVYLTMEFRADLSDLGSPNSPNAIKHRFLGVGERVLAPDGSEGRILIRGTWNTAIIDGLAPERDDIIVSKRRYSGFYETELDTVLRSRGIESLVFTGCTTSVCVESTLRDAMFRDYRCLLLADCTGEPIGASLARGNHEATLLVVETLFGWVSDSGALIEGLTAGRATEEGEAGAQQAITIGR